MKRIILLIVILFAFFTIENNAKTRVSFGYFYSSLMPYGEWIEVDAGITAWRPVSVQMNWKPYTIGRWSWTKYGWYWDSYEPFGWAVYHYGRWYYDDFYGWIWIPDNTWGPAWVEWRYDNDYIGWAPLPPYASFRINVGIYFSIKWNSHYSYWNFVRYNRFHDHRIFNYIVDSRNNHKIFGRTKYRTNYYYDRGRIINGGITRSFVESRSGNRISERDFVEVDNPGNIERNRTRTSGDRIYSYRLDEKILEREPINERLEIKKGERATSLNRDKIEILGNERVTERKVETDRNISTEKNSQPREVPNINRNENRSPRVERNDTNEKSERKVETQRNRNNEISKEARIESSERNRPANRESRISNENKRETKRESNSGRAETRSNNNSTRNERSAESRR